MATGSMWLSLVVREFLSLSAFGTGGRTAEFFPHFLHSALWDWAAIRWADKNNGWHSPPQPILDELQGPRSQEPAKLTADPTIDQKGCDTGLVPRLPWWDPGYDRLPTRAIFLRGVVYGAIFFSIALVYFETFSLLGWLMMAAGCVYFALWMCGVLESARPKPDLCHCLFAAMA